MPGLLKNNCHIKCFGFKGLVFIGLIFLCLNTFKLSAQVRPGSHFVDVVFPVNNIGQQRNFFPDSIIDSLNAVYHVFAKEASCLKVKIGGQEILDTSLKYGWHSFILPELKGFTFDTVLPQGISTYSSSPIILYKTIQLKDGLARNWNSLREGLKLKSELQHMEASALQPSSDLIRHSNDLFSPGSSYNYEYFKANPNAFRALESGVYFLVSTKDSTKVIIDHQARIADNYSSRTFHNPGDIDSLILNEGDAFYLIGSNSMNPSFINLSKVNATNLKIGFTEAVLSYYLDPNNINEEPTFRGHDVNVFEDPLPYSQLGKNFHIGPLLGYLGHSISLFSLYDSTTVFLNGQRRLFQARERLDTVIPDDLSVFSDKEVVVFSSALPTSRLSPTNSNEFSSFCFNVFGDKNLVDSLLIPRFPGLGATNEICQIVCASSDTANIRLNGMPLNGFSPFRLDSSFAYLNYELGLNDSLISSTSGCIAYLYTYNDTGMSSLNNSFGNFGVNLFTYKKEAPYEFAAQANNQKFPIYEGDTLILCNDSIFKIFPDPRLGGSWEIFTSDSIWTSHLSADDSSLTIPVSVGITLDSLSIKPSLDCAESFRLYFKERQVEIQVKQEEYLSCEGHFLTLNATSKAGIIEDLKWVVNKTEYWTQTLRLKNPKDSLKLHLEYRVADCQFRIDTIITLNKSDLLEPTLPNFISPNGDGINDQLCFSQYNVFEGCYSLQVFNRNGLEVFKSSQASECWTPLSSLSGVYYYLLRVQGKSYRGFITLIP